MEKQSTLLNYLTLNEIEIAILTETWLDSSTMSDNFNFFCQYELVSRVDRLKGQHGGVAVLRKTSSDLVTRQINFLKSDFGTAFKVDNSSEALVFMCVYLPPSTSKYRVPPEQLELFIDSCLKNMNHSYPKEKFSVSPLLLGDFNLPACNWKLMTSPSHQEKEILNILISHSLEPLIHDTPTHHRGGTLDNVLIDAGSVAASTSCQVRRDLLTSDHFPIEVLVDTRILLTNPILPTQYCFNQATNLNKFVESWTYFIFDASSTSNDVTTFYDFLWNSMRTNFQRKRSKRKESILL